MLGTRLHWVDGPWTGKLAMAARPRGGDWLADEMDDWRGNRIDTVLSLLEKHEERDLDLAEEGPEARAHGMKFLSFPIPDRQVPESGDELARVVDEVHRELCAGRNVVLHCRQGVGRTGLVAACLMVAEGVEVETAIARLSAARGLVVPETVEQRRWVERFQQTLATAR